MKYCQGMKLSNYFVAQLGERIYYSCKLQPCIFQRNLKRVLCILYLFTLFDNFMAITYLSNYVILCMERTSRMMDEDCRNVMCSCRPQKRVSHFHIRPRRPQIYLDSLISDSLCTCVCVCVYARLCVCVHVCVS